MGTKRVLIVEDDDCIRETLKLVLESNGYQVFTASNGKEGLELLPQVPRPSVILLDLMMPVMDGWGFVEELEHKDALSTIPVVVVSAFKEKAPVIKADQVIRKPVDIGTLYKVVDQYCH